MNRLVLSCRAVAFYSISVLSIIPYSFIVVLFGWLFPFRYRYGFIIAWVRFCLFALRWCCGVHCEIKGRENIPAQAAVFVANHESTWEALQLQTLFDKVATVIKRELLALPFFGWGLAYLKPIAIDRSTRKLAMQQTQAIGLDRIREGISVLIFPQGTRVNPGQAGGDTQWAKGAAALAVSAGAPIVPIAHNAARCWPRGKVIKYPGTIKVSIGAPFASEDRRPEDLIRQCQDWVAAEKLKFKD